jgi:hypothetical protein
MSEKCPLEAGDHKIGDIPEFCHKHCEQAWDASIRGTHDIDWYGVDCGHPDSEVETSHEALIKPDESSHREYVIVDQCANCGNEEN